MYTLVDSPQRPLHLFGCFPFAADVVLLLARGEDDVRPVVPTFVLPMTPKDVDAVNCPPWDGWRLELDVGIRVLPELPAGESWLRLDDDCNWFAW